MKEKLSSDSRQIYQYQQNVQPSLTTNLQKDDHEIL